jgi:hypothetical protein
MADAQKHPAIVARSAKPSVSRTFLVRSRGRECPLGVEPIVRARALRLDRGSSRDGRRVPERSAAADGRRRIGSSGRDA